MGFKEEVKLDDKREEYYSPYKYTCECGHVLLIKKDETKKLCKYCGHYVYINKSEEFKDKLINKINKTK